MFLSDEIITWIHFKKSIFTYLLTCNIHHGLVKKLQCFLLFLAIAVF
jgi:hypothetical protein